MRAELVINTLLNAAAGVTAITASRIYPGSIPPLIGGSPLAGAALVFWAESGSEEPPFSADQFPGETPTRVTIRISGCVPNDAATSLGISSYQLLKNLMEQVRLACNYKSGSIGGVTVFSTRRTNIGGDTQDEQLGMWFQYFDFEVLFKE